MQYREILSHNDATYKFLKITEILPLYKFGDILKITGEVEYVFAQYTWVSAQTVHSK